MRVAVRPLAFIARGFLPMCAFVTSAACAAIPTYQVQDLGTLGGATTQATDINDAGQITGYSETADGELRAFLYSRGQLRGLGTLGGAGSLGNAINAAGQVAGFAVTPSGHTHAVVFANGSAMDLAITGGDSVASDISNLGQVVGQRTGSDGHNRAFAYILGVTYDLKGPAGFDSFGIALNDLGQVLGTYYDAAGSHAFLFSALTGRKDLVPGKVSSIYGSQALNALGQVTGSFADQGVTHGFVYQNGRVTDIGGLGGDYSFGFGINAKADVTGVSARADGQRHAVIYSAGRMTDLGTLGGTTSFGYAINSSKQVAGESNLKSGGFHAFVYSQGKLTDLGAAIEATHGKKFIESVAYGINSAGQVIGRYYPTDANGHVVFRSFLATPVLNLFNTLLHDVTGVGPGKSFQDTVTQARQAYVAQNQKTTCSALSSLQKEIKAQTGKKVATATGAALQTETAALKQTLSCP
jgi:probable HAF family extracellular repeat protein